MNELLIIGLVCGALVLMFIATSIIENIDVVFGWLYDLGTAWCKFRQRRRRVR